MHYSPKLFSAKHQRGPVWVPTILPLWGFSASLPARSGSSYMSDHVTRFTELCFKHMTRIDHSAVYFLLNLCHQPESGRLDSAQGLLYSQVWYLMSCQPSFNIQAMFTLTLYRTPTPPSVLTSPQQVCADSYVAPQGYKGEYSKPQNQKYKIF